MKRHDNCETIKVREAFVSRLRLCNVLFSGFCGRDGVYDFCGQPYLNPGVTTDLNS